MFDRLGGITLELDALTGDVSPDGLKNRRDIKILICYLLRVSTEPLTKDDLLGIMREWELANYFEACHGLDILIKVGNVVELSENGFLSLSDNGAVIADTLYSGLPYTVREKGRSAAMSVITRRRSERQNVVSVDSISGGYQVTCKVLSGDIPIMTISLYVPDEQYAERIRNKFLDVPEALYRSVLSYLTDEDLSHLPKPEKDDDKEEL